MFPNAKMSFDAALSNVALVLLNSHFSINAPRPYVPNMIEIGGIQVNREPNELPKVLKMIIHCELLGYSTYKLFCRK